MVVVSGVWLPVVVIILCRCACMIVQIECVHIYIVCTTNGQLMLKYIAPFFSTLNTVTVIA